MIEDVAADGLVAVVRKDAFWEDDADAAARAGQAHELLDEEHLDGPPGTLTSTGTKLKLGEQASVGDAAGACAEGRVAYDCVQTAVGKR